MIAIVGQLQIEQGVTRPGLMPNLDLDRACSGWTDEFDEWIALKIGQSLGVDIVLEECLVGYQRSINECRDRRSQVIDPPDR